MKTNLTEVIVGGTYFYDVENILSTLRKGIKTVKVLSIGTSSIAEVWSIETKEKFITNIGHLQLDPEYLKQKYQKLVQYYLKMKLGRIFMHTSSKYDESKTYVIIGNNIRSNCLQVLGKDGIIKSFGYGWFKGLNLEKNYDIEQVFLMGDHYNNYDEIAQEYI